MPETVFMTLRIWFKMTGQAKQVFLITVIRLLCPSGEGPMKGFRLITSYHALSIRLYSYANRSVYIYYLWLAFEAHAVFC